MCNFFLSSSFKLYGFLIWMNHLKQKNEEPVLACEIIAFILVDGCPIFANSSTNWLLKVLKYKKTHNSDYGFA